MGSQSSGVEIDDCRGFSLEPPKEGRAARRVLLANGPRFFLGGFANAQGQEQDEIVAGHLRDDCSREFSGSGSLSYRFNRRLGRP